MSLGDATSLADAAQRLGMTGPNVCAQLTCAIVRGRECKRTGCTNASLENNLNKCAACHKNWWPKPAVGVLGSLTSKPAQRGCLLLGPTFMRCREGQGDARANNTTCCCGLPKCFEIGWCGNGAVKLSKDATLRQAMYDQVCMQPRARARRVPGRVPNGIVLTCAPIGRGLADWASAKGG